MAVGEALALEKPQPLGGERTVTILTYLRLFPHQLLDVREEPRIDAGELGDAQQRPAGAERIGDIQQAVRARRAQLVREAVLVLIRKRHRQLRVEPIEPGLEPAQRLLE